MCSDTCSQVDHAKNILRRKAQGLTQCKSSTVSQYCHLHRFSKEIRALGMILYCDFCLLPRMHTQNISNSNLHVAAQRNQDKFKPPNDQNSLRTFLFICVSNILGQRRLLEDRRESIQVSSLVDSVCLLSACLNNSPALCFGMHKSCLTSARVCVAVFITRTYIREVEPRTNAHAIGHSVESVGLLLQSAVDSENPHA